MKYIGVLNTHAGFYLVGITKRGTIRARGVSTDGVMLFPDLKSIMELSDGYTWTLALDEDSDGFKELMKNDQ